MSEPLTDEELTKARQLADAASPGPWTIVPGGAIYGSVCPVIFGVLVGDDPEPVTYVCTDDSNFITASRTLVPALLDEIDRLRAEVKALRARELSAEERDLVVEVCHDLINRAMRDERDQREELRGYRETDDRRKEAAIRKLLANGGG